MPVNSKFGFGCMRLPLTDENNPASINQKLFNQMIDYYMKKGHNFFDTSYAYHNGQSEIALRKGLVERYPRESFEIADKMPTWLLEKEADNERYFNEMLERLGIDYFDKFHVHNINVPFLKKAKNAKAFEFSKKMKKEGKAKQIGFSFHDSAELLKKVLEEYGEGLDFVQLELNYMDWEDPVIEAKNCYDLCVKHGLDVYVMEPLKGGTIVNTSDEIKNEFKNFNPNKSIASFALRFCASLEHVKIVLSGMSNMDDLIDNCKTYENFEDLNDEEKEFLSNIASKLRNTLAVPCSECNYCVDYCPENIPIPEYFKIYNLSKQSPSNIYTSFFAKLEHEKVPTDECTYCGSCIDYCTQKIDIPEMLEKAREDLSDGFNPYD